MRKISRTFMGWIWFAILTLLMYLVWLQKKKLPLSLLKLSTDNCQLTSACGEVT
jgi:hypothetical protein